jgi:hypothetical protein
VGAIRRAAPFASQSLPSSAPIGTAEIADPVHVAVPGPLTKSEQEVCVPCCTEALRRGPPCQSPHVGKETVWICTEMSQNRAHYGNRCEVCSPGMLNRWRGDQVLTKRSLIASAFTLTVLATAGCGGVNVVAKPTATSSPTTSAPSSPSSSPTPTIDPKAQPAVDAYLAYMTASNNALRNPRALGQDFAPGSDYTKYAFDPERSEFSDYIGQLSSQGLKMAGNPGRPRPTVRSIDLAAKPYPLVVLTDCPTSAAKWDAYEVKTGKDVTVPPPAGTVPPPYRTTVQVINFESHWGVSKITTDSGRTCSE